MINKVKKAVALGAAATLGLTLAACGGDGESSSLKENELVVKAGAKFESADPARIYYGVQIAHFRRTLYRGLVAFNMSSDAKEGTTPVADLATDTGTATNGQKTWSFTVKDGVKWEDGSDITCGDFAYGASRIFATDKILGGPLYLIDYLDIPKNDDGSSKYKGPYVDDAAGQAMFDKAVSCEGNTITYKFNKPWADFPLAVAGTLMADPYKKSFDKADQGTWKVLSNGPYKLDKGTWSKDKGALMVRNENYDAKTDDPAQLRKALPDSIDYAVDSRANAPALINDAMIADKGDTRYTISTSRVQPQQFSKLTGDVAKRWLSTDTPYNSYLVPNFKQKVMQNPAVREALAVSTNLNGYLEAIGGDKVGTPAETIINPSNPGGKANPAFAKDDNNNGDPKAAAKILKDAGVATPVKIKVGYGQTDANDKGFAVLAAGWDEAGFETELAPLSDTYYDVIGKADDDYDVTWAGWAADWPGQNTVLGPLFDGRGVTKDSCNPNYGCYQSDEYNALYDSGVLATTPDAQIKGYQAADALLGKDYAYIPLENTKFNWLYGSKVTGFTTSVASNGYPELGAIGVDKLVK